MPGKPCPCELKPEAHPCWKHSASGLCVTTLNRNKLWNPSACEQCWQYAVLLYTGSTAEKNNARELLQGIRKGVRAHAGRVGNSGVTVLPLKI